MCVMRHRGPPMGTQAGAGTLWTWDSSSLPLLVWMQQSPPRPMRPKSELTPARGHHSRGQRDSLEERRALPWRREPELPWDWSPILHCLMWGSHSEGWPTTQPGAEGQGPGQAQTALGELSAQHPGWHPPVPWGCFRSKSSCDAQKVESGQAPNSVSALCWVIWKGLGLGLDGHLSELLPNAWSLSLESHAWVPVAVRGFSFEFVL